jgi:hypothetical protein
MTTRLTRETTTVLEELQLHSRRTDTQPVSAVSLPLPAGAATAAKQSDGTQASMFVNELGVPYGVKHINNKPRVSSMPYLYDIAEGNVTDHVPFAKLG